MIERMLRGGVQRYVHLNSDQLKKRMESGEELPLVCVRLVSRPGKMYIYRKVEILGPSSLAEIEHALPHTNGRGICPLITEAPLRVFVDDPNMEEEEAVG